MDNYITPQENANRQDINPAGGPGATGPLPELHEPDYIMVRHATVRPGTPTTSTKPQARRGAPALMLALMLALSTLFGAGGAGAVLLVAGNNSSNTAVATTTTANTSAATSAQLVVQADEATINGIYNKL